MASHNWWCARLERLRERLAKADLTALVGFTWSFGSPAADCFHLEEILNPEHAALAPVA